MKAEFETPADLLGSEGTEMGPSDWMEVTQKAVDEFANSTGDHQWIHVDPERAKSGPFGGTIAHGYWTLSVVNFFLPQLLEVKKMSMGVNYGCEKLRFPAPVPVGSKVRAKSEIIKATEVTGGVQVVVRVTIECDRADKPACVAETISRFYP